MWWEFGILCAIAAYLFYRWATAKNDFFKERGIPYDKPTLLLGSMTAVVLRQKSMFDIVIDLYNKHSGLVYGIFDQRNPLLMLRDPDVIKQITIKDFDHFVNHRSIFTDSSEDNLFSTSLFSMRDGKWKDMRSTLSPAFTGSKMRQMFHLINQVAEASIEYLKRDRKLTKNLDLDMKDYCTRFTNDIIASTAFGLQVNSFEERENKFYAMGKKLTTFTALQNFKFFMFGNFKYLMKLLKIELFDKQQTDYFMRLVMDAMKYRKENNISRPDMINMLMEARGMIASDNPKPHNREWSDVDIVSQCFIFFFAGFETSAVLMCFAAHELMENPETQQKLLAEIEDVVAQLNGKPLTYEALHGMKYMDMVTSETLRKWPAAIAIDRECNKDYVCEKNGERIEVKKGESIWIPVAGIQRDPQYYENPNKFDPERFSEENKDKINPLTFLPFGIGPRNCIGSRFALLEAKAILFYLVRNFSLEASKKSTIPLKLNASSFQLAPKNGYWLKLVDRTPN